MRDLTKIHYEYMHWFSGQIDLSMFLGYLADSDGKPKCSIIDNRRSPKFPRFSGSVGRCFFAEKFNFRQNSKTTRFCARRAVRLPRVRLLLQLCLCEACQSDLDPLEQSGKERRCLCQQFHWKSAKLLPWGAASHQEPQPSTNTS